MKTRLFLLLAAWLMPLFLAAAIKPSEPTASPATPADAQSSPVSSGTGKAYVFPLKEVVSDTVATFMRRALKDAERAGASTFVIEMDTPGGELGAMVDILEMLRKTSLKTYTFVNPSAGSAGALIALGTDAIFMRPDAVIGAAAVITGTGEDLQKTLKLKVDSFNTAKMRAVASEHGHNPDIAEAFMVTEKELRVGDALIDSKETLLSLNGKEAVMIYDGRPLLAKGLAESVEEVVKAIGGAEEIVRVEPSGFESIAFWILRLAPLLLMGGIIGGYVEMKTPGFGIPGMISLICFGLYFGGHYIAGLAGAEVVVVFFLGLILVILEVFVFPGTILAGLVGTMLMLGALLWAMVDYWPSTPGLPTGEALQRPVANLVLAIAGSGMAMFFLARILPKTPLYRRLVLSAAVPAGPAVSVPVVNLSVKPGHTGKALTTLRPAGKAEFAGEPHDVVTVGDFLPAGTPVRVVETDGVRVVVEACATVETSVTEA